MPDPRPGNWQPVKRLPVVMHADAVSAARAVAAVPHPHRAWVLHRIMAEADAADDWRRRWGVMHPRWGDGTLMTAALRRTVIREPPLDDAEWCRVLAFVYLALARRAEGALPLGRDGAG